MSAAAIFQSVLPRRAASAPLRSAASLRCVSTNPSADSAPSDSASSPSPVPSTSSQPASTSPSPPVRLATQLLLHRRAYLTPTPPKVLTAIHAYNERLSHALSTPFPEHLYLKKGTLAARRFTYEEAVRAQERYGVPVSEEIEKIDPDAALDEVRERDALERENEDRGEKSLERKGENSLYLVVRREEGWRFPGGEGEAPVGLHPEMDPRSDYLHERAQHHLFSLLGPNISLWPVSRLPIAYLPPSPTTSSSAQSSSSSSSSSPSPELKTFVFKSHVLAGQGELTPHAAKAGVTDFAWLTKREIGDRVGGDEQGRAWWSKVEDLMNDH